VLNALRDMWKCRYSCYHDFFHFVDVVFEVGLDFVINIFQAVVGYLAFCQSSIGKSRTSWRRNLPRFKRYAGSLSATLKNCLQKTPMSCALYLGVRSCTYVMSTITSSLIADITSCLSHALLCRLKYWSNSHSPKCSFNINLEIIIAMMLRKTLQKYH